MSINIPDSSRPLAKTHVYSNISRFSYPLRHAAAAHFLCLCFLSSSLCFSFSNLIVNRDAAGWELSKQQDNNNCLLSPRIHTNTHRSIWLLLTESEYLTNLNQWCACKCVCVCVCVWCTHLSANRIDFWLRHSQTFAQSHTCTLMFIYGNEWTHIL